MPSIWFNRGFALVTDRVFVPVMKLVVAARYVVVAAMILLLSLSASSILRGEVAWSFFTAPEAGSVTGNFAFLPGATRDDARAMTSELTRAVDAVASRLEAETGIYPVVHALTQVGGTAAKGLPGQETMNPDTLGSIDIGLVDADKRDFSAQDFVRELNMEVVRPAGLALLSFRTQGRWPRRRQPVGQFLWRRQLCPQIRRDRPDRSARRLSRGHGPSGQPSTWPRGHGAQPDPGRRGARLHHGVHRHRAVRAPQWHRRRDLFPPARARTNVTVGLPASELGPAFLADTLMRAPTGAWVPLGEIVTTKSTPGFSTINREDGRRLVTVSGGTGRGRSRACR